MHFPMIALQRAGRFSALLILFLLAASSVQAADLLVPSQYTTIQAAISCRMSSSWPTQRMGSSSGCAR